MMSHIRLIQAIAFFSAVLLFQIELIIANVFLPNFGGSYMVWGACVVFFQAVLLVGYKYSQVVVDKFGLLRYRGAHCLLALLPLLFFPGRSLPLTFEPLPVPLVLAVFWHLCLFIGPVFFVLSTTSVIWQVWLSSSSLPERNNPYALFAVSNAGSLAALVSYPLLVEPYLDLSAQQNVWRVGYLVFILLQWWAYKTIPVKPPRERHTRLKPVATRKVIGWICYSAAGVMMFLSVTNIVTAEVAPIPLLWVVPLVIYLASFILNFKKKPYCPNWLKEDIHLVIGMGVIVYFVVQVPMLPELLDMLLLFAGTYLVCMYTQYQLYRKRPGDHRYIPYYYFIVSLGGFLGGFIVSWVIPLVSTTFAEYFAAFLMISVAGLVENRRKPALSGFILAAGLLVLLLVWPQIFNQEQFRHTWLQFAGMIGLSVATAWAISSMKSQNAVFTAYLAVLMVIAPVIESRWSLTEHVYRHRNYYGITKIRQTDDAWILVHGTTIHGAQYRDSEKAHIPLAYYSYDSPAGQLLKQDRFGFNRMGIIGLGIGSLATYFRPDQTVDIFELDKDVYAMAQRHFLYLSRAAGEITYHIGDGRLLMEGEDDGAYDLLIIDAFSGDAIPVHLLTAEALQLYKRKLRDNGLLLFHISNRYIDIAPPLVKTARALGAQAAIKAGEKTVPYTEYSRWLLVTWDATRFAILKKEDGWQSVLPDDKRIRTWTDRRHSELLYIDFDSLAQGVASFLRSTSDPPR